MKPAPFDYRCPDSIEEALALLTAYGDDAKLIAGGQSLMPMLNFRVVRPQLLVDIRRLLELDFLRARPDGGLSVGALTRHRVLETSPEVARRFPVVPEAMRHVAHLAIRNRGTIGGSVAHADPAAELPMLTRLLDADLILRSSRGERTVAAADFFVGTLATALRSDEILMRIELPGLPPHGGAFEEFARRAGDFALAAVGVVLEAADGHIQGARVAMMGVADTPLRNSEVEAALIGRVFNDETVTGAVRVARETLDPRRDLHASADYRRHLAGVLLERTLRRAWIQAEATTAGGS